MKRYIIVLMATFLIGVFIGKVVFKEPYKLMRKYEIINGKMVKTFEDDRRTK